MHIANIYISYFPFTSDTLAEKRREERRVLFKIPRTTKTLAMHFYSCNCTVLIPEDV